MICASIMSGSIGGMLSRARAASARGAEAVEFRIDSLESPTLDGVLSLKAADMVSIATFKGDSLSLLSGGAEEIFGTFDFVDIGLDDEGTIPLTDGMRDKLILSYHGDVQSEDEAERLIRSALGRCSIVKCINTSAGYSRARLPFMAARALSPGRVTAFSTGESGTLSRIASMKHAAPVAYSSLSQVDATAPGQLTIEEMQAALDGIVLGIAGSREAAEHSLSPAIQGMMLEEAGLRGLYLRFPVEEGGLPGFFESASDAGALGFNVTMPYKEQALSLASGADSVSEAVGAANTLVREGSGFRAYNTDAEAAYQIVSERRPGTALILGSGGAARAAAHALRGADVVIASRNRQKGFLLAREFGMGEFDASRTRFDMIVNCTPAGMEGRPFELPPALRGIRAGTVVDFVYSNSETPFGRLAEEWSADYVGGLEILARQAVLSFRLWTGVEFGYGDLLRHLGVAADGR